MTNFNGTKSVTPVLWNRSGLSTERLTAAVRRAKTFPADGLPEEVAVLYEHAAAASSARELLQAHSLHLPYFCRELYSIVLCRPYTLYWSRLLLQANDWEGLLAFLGDLKPELARDMDELKMAWQVCRLPHGICIPRTIERFSRWLRRTTSPLSPRPPPHPSTLYLLWQEYLTVALERAATSKDQADLKQTLRLATEHGMLATERPVWKALEVFVDPPTIIFQPPAQVGVRGGSAPTYPLRHVT